MDCLPTSQGLCTYHGICTGAALATGQYSVPGGVHYTTYTRRGELVLGMPSQANLVTTSH